VQIALRDAEGTTFFAEAERWELEGTRARRAQGLPFARAFAFSARPGHCLALRFATHAAKSLIESLAASGRQPVRKIGHEGLDDLAGGIVNPLDIVKAGDDRVARASPPVSSAFHLGRAACAWAEYDPY